MDSWVQSKLQLGNLTVEAGICSSLGAHHSVFVPTCARSSCWLNAHISSSTGHAHCLEELNWKISKCVRLSVSFGVGSLCPSQWLWVFCCLFLTKIFLYSITYKRLYGAVLPDFSYDHGTNKWIMTERFLTQKVYCIHILKLLTQGRSFWMPFLRFYCAEDICHLLICMDCICWVYSFCLSSVVFSELVLGKYWLIFIKFRHYINVGRAGNVSSQDNVDGSIRKDLN